MLASGARTEFIPFYGITFSKPPVTRAFLVIIFAVPVTVLLILAVRQLVRTPALLYAWAVLANCLFIVFSRVPRQRTCWQCFGWQQVWSCRRCCSALRMTFAGWRELCPLSGCRHPCSRS